MVRKCEIYQNKESQETWPLTKTFYSEAGDVMNVENEKIRQARALAGFLSAAKVCRLRIRKHLVSLAK